MCACSGKKAVSQIHQKESYTSSAYNDNAENTTTNFDAVSSGGNMVDLVSEFGTTSSEDNMLIGLQYDDSNFLDENKLLERRYIVNPKGECVKKL